MSPRALGLYCDWPGHPVLFLVVMGIRHATLWEKNREIGKYLFEPSSISVANDEFLVGQDNIFKKME